MSEHVGDKTEQATPRRQEEAVKRGQIPRSAEVQTVFVLVAALLAFKFTGAQLWFQLRGAQYAILGHLHDIPISMDILPRYAVRAVMVFAACVAPVVLGTMAASLLAGGIQSRFQT